MTLQEIRWVGQFVQVTGTVSNNGRFHQYVSEYLDCVGIVLREAKNGMLLVQIGPKATRAFPSGCLSTYIPL